MGIVGFVCVPFILFAIVYIVFKYICNTYEINISNERVVQINVLPISNNTISSKDCIVDDNSSIKIGKNEDEYVVIIDP